MTDLHRSRRLPTSKAKKTLAPDKRVQEDGKEESELSLLCDEELNSSSPVRDDNASGDMVDWLGRLKDNGKCPSSRRSSTSSVNADVFEYSLSTELSEEMGNLIFGNPCVGLPQQEPAKQVEDAQRHKSLRFANEPLFPARDEAHLSLSLRGSSKFLRMRPVTPENPGRHLYSKDSCPSSLSPYRAKTVAPILTASKTITPSFTIPKDKQTESKKPSSLTISTDKQKESKKPSRLITSTDNTPERKKRPSLTTSTDKTLESKKQRTRAPSTKASARPRITPKNKVTNFTASRPATILTIKVPLAMRTATASTAASSLSAASARSASSRSSLLSILNSTHSAEVASVPTLTQPQWGKPQDLFQVQQPPRHHSDEVRLFDDDLSQEDDFPEDASFGLANARDLLEPDTSVYMYNRGPNRADIPTEIFAVADSRDPLEPDTSVYMCNHGQNRADIPTEIFAMDPSQHYDSHHLPWFPVEPPTMMMPPRQQSSPWSSVGYFQGRTSSSSPWSSVRYFNGRTSSSEASIPVPEYGQQPPAAMIPAMQRASYGRKTRACLIDEEPEDPIVICGNDFLDHPLQNANVPQPLPSPLTDRRSTSSDYKRMGLRLSRSHSNRSDDDDEFGGLLRHIFIASPNQPLHHSPNSPNGPFRFAPNGPHCPL